MAKLCFELARLDHAKAIEAMRIASAADLTAKLGSGPWSGVTKLASIRERIKCADPENLRRTTLYVACQGGIVVGAVAASTFPPGFWRRSYWSAGKEVGLGVFGLVVPPELQRQGIGRFLMNSVEQLAREHQIGFVRLDAFLLNPFSVAFYQAVGYNKRVEIDLRGTGLILFEKSIP